MLRVAVHPVEARRHRDRARGGPASGTRQGPACARAQAMIRGDWIEVAGDPDRLDAWLGGARLPVRVVEGAPAVRAVAIGARILR